MPLASLAQVKLMLGLTDGTQDVLLTGVCDGVDRAIRNWLHRDVIESQTVTLYLSGNGTPDLILPHRPVTSITSVNVDQAGYWGTGPGGYPASTLWTEGTHFALIRDDYGASAAPGKSAVLRRLGGALPGGGFLNWPPWPLPATPGLLAAGRAPYWPIGEGNVKVVGVFGYATVPADLVLAANELAVMVYRRSAHGFPLQSESYAGYSYSLATALIAMLWKMPGSALSVLATYRELPVA